MLSRCVADVELASWACKLVIFGRLEARVCYFPIEIWYLGRLQRNKDANLLAYAWTQLPQGPTDVTSGQQQAAPPASLLELRRGIMGLCASGLTDFRNKDQLLLFKWALGGKNHVDMPW